MSNDNFSQDEINKFNEFAKDWWDPHGSMRPLHLLNPVRSDYITSHARVSQKKLLDVGCGAGLLSEALATRGADVTAIDLSEGALKVAKAHALESSLDIQYIETSAEAIAQQYPAQFDVVTCMEMLEHVPDPAAVIQACADATKTGGHLFFSTINRSWRGYIKAIVGAEYVLRLLPRGTHQYDKLIRPSELCDWAQQAGLTLINLSGVSYNPFTEKVTLTTDVSVNYLCCFKKD